MVLVEVVLLVVVVVWVGGSTSMFRAALSCAVLRCAICPSCVSLVSLVCCALSLAIRNSVLCCVPVAFFFRTCLEYFLLCAFFCLTSSCTSSCITCSAFICCLFIVSFCSFALLCSALPCLPCSALSAFARLCLDCALRLFFFCSAFALLCPALL